MRKSSLDVKTLKVESFETESGNAETRGTVHGNALRTQGPTFCATMCGAECPSGPVPCEGSAAWTDGMAACVCDDTLKCID